MDYIDFVTLVLRRLIEVTDASPEYLAFGVPKWNLGTIVFDVAVENRSAHELSTRLPATLGAISTLESLGLAESGHFGHGSTLPDHVSVTQRGRRAVHDLTPIWREICAVDFDGGHATLLRILNRLGSKEFPDHALLECVDGDRISPIRAGPGNQIRYGRPSTNWSEPDTR